MNVEKLKRRIHELEKALAAALNDHQRPEDCEPDCWSHEARRVLENKEDCTEPDRARCPRGCQSFCNKAEQEKERRGR